MTIEELHIKLIELGVSEDKYYLHGLYGSTSDEAKLALLVKQGKYSIEYEVYYKEKGEKYLIKIFTIEDDACQYLYKRLKMSKEMEDEKKGSSNA